MVYFNKTRDTYKVEQIGIVSAHTDWFSAQTQCLSAQTRLVSAQTTTSSAHTHSTSPNFHKKMAIPLQTPLKSADFLLLLGEKAGFEFESAVVGLQRTQQEDYLVFSGFLLEEKGIFKRNE